MGHLALLPSASRQWHVVGRGGLAGLTPCARCHVAWVSVHGHPGDSGSGAALAIEAKAAHDGPRRARGPGPGYEPGCLVDVSRRRQRRFSN
eukprot:11444572-Alexandrium_andersonii.AAC.1